MGTHCMVPKTGPAQWTNLVREKIRVRGRKRLDLAFMQHSIKAGEFTWGEKGLCVYESKVFFTCGLAIGAIGAGGFDGCPCGLLVALHQQSAGMIKHV